MLKPYRDSSFPFLVIAVFFLCLFFLLLYVYSFSLNGPFIWDDHLLVRDNADIRSWNNTYKVITTPWSSGANVTSSFYRPLPTLTFMLDYSLYGLNTGGYHVTNVLIHFLTAVALFWSLSFIFPSGVLMTAVLFWSVFPANVEAVANIGARTEMLSCLFILLSLGAYLRFDRIERKRWLLLFLLFFVCALLTKESALVTVFVLGAYHFCFSKRVKIPAIAALGIVLIIYFSWRAYVFSGAAFPFSPFLTYKIIGKAALACAAFFDYLRMFFWPIDLHMEYMDWPVSFFDQRVILGFILLVTAIIFISLKRRSHQSACFMMGWFVVSLIPFCGIYPLPFYKADHYLYFPACSFFVLFCFVVTHMGWFLKYSRVVIFITVIVAISYSAISVRQNLYWSDAFYFYEKTLNYSPDSERVTLLLAWEYFNAGRRDIAADILRRFVEKHPSAKAAKADLERMLLPT